MIEAKKWRINPRSSIYGRVVLTIAALSVLFFVTFGIIFRGVNDRHLNKVCKQSGSNIGSIVEGSLYHAMLTNDWPALENTMDVINNLEGIEDLNLYDKEENLVYSSFTGIDNGHSNPNCKDCHDEIRSLFNGDERAYRIINLESDCEMTSIDHDYRLLMIHSPIKNEPSCHTAACHAHDASDPVLGAFVIRIPMEALDEAISQSSNDFFIMAALASLILITFLYFFTRRTINRPLKAIIDATEAVSKGSKSTRLNLDPGLPQDVQLVSETFNSMLDKLQAASNTLEDWSHQLEDKVQEKSEELMEIQKELVHVERMASLGKLSSSVAHEINNPLSGVLTYTKLVHKQLKNLEFDSKEKASMLKYLKVIEEETKRCGGIVKGLLDFSRKDKQQFTYNHLHKVLRDAYVLMEHQMKISDIEFKVDYSAANDLVFCNENQIKQAVIAILLNGTEAITDNGEILIRTSNPDLLHFQFDITDNGYGIAEKDLPHVFDPFYSAKEKVSGIGMGLSVVHGIVQNHHGKVEVRSEVGEGTTMTIVLPLSQPPDPG